MTAKRTLVGGIDPDVLAFTAGRDVDLDRVLIEADCIGTAAHVTMLSRVPAVPPLLSLPQASRVVKELVEIVLRARKGTFRIRQHDQDVHLAIERVLTEKLGDLGRRVHTARSRNDQVAVDLRLYAKEQLLGTMDEIGRLASQLLKFGRRHAAVPMVGRTHMQPAMPSTVGLWASAYAESLLDDLDLVRGVYALNDRCPLGSAAGYGVPVAIDRDLTARLLGFSGPVHNVLHAANSRGKCEAAVLSAMSQVMLSLSRLAEDMMIYSMPEFGYFSLPQDFCTGSSIMPQKNNPDVLELVRAKAFRVLAHAAGVAGIVAGLPGGYNRDLQETKEPFIDGLGTTRECLRILCPLVGQIRVNRRALKDGFHPGVFATDRALELVAGGMPFRDAYNHVKAHPEELARRDPRRAADDKRHAGAPGGLDWEGLRARSREANVFVKAERRKYDGAISRLLGVGYPELTPLPRPGKPTGTRRRNSARRR